MSKGIIFKGNLDEGDYKLIKTTDGWVLQGETSYIGFDTDTPQAEWIEMYRDGFGNLICMCSKCNYHAQKSRYCPFCGERMKGIEDDLSTHFKATENPLTGIKPKPIPTTKHTFKYQQRRIDNE